MFPNCPGKGAVTTEIVPLYTTVCPVTEAETATAGPKPTGPAVVVGAECPGGVKCPIKGEVPATQSAVFSTVTKVPATSAAAGTSKVSSSSPSPTKPGSAGSTTGASGCSGAGCPKPSASHVVTAGAGRVASAFGLPVLVAAVFFAL